MKTESPSVRAQRLERELQDRIAERRKGYDWQPKVISRRFRAEWEKECGQTWASGELSAPSVGRLYIVWTQYTYLPLAPSASTVHLIFMPTPRVIYQRIYPGKVLWQGCDYTVFGERPWCIRWSIWKRNALDVLINGITTTIDWPEIGPDRHRVKNNFTVEKVLKAK